MQISDLGLSRRTLNCLYRAGIKTVEELQSKHNWELQSIRSFGNKSLREVLDALSRLEPTPRILSNADRIRAMDDEALADFIEHLLDVECISPMKRCETSCNECILNWLQQPPEV